MSTIKSVYQPDGLEDIGDHAIVGYNSITRIERREENLGSYVIVWYDAYADKRLVKSFNAMHVSSIHYNGE